MDRQPLLAMGRHYPGKALRIRSRPSWQIAIRGDWFSYERTRMSYSAARVWRHCGEAIAKACTTNRTLPCSIQGNEPFRGEIRSKALTVWREIETATVEGTRWMKRAGPTAG